ncbi:hypothetical protein SNEBB_004913 [Seison nebaliae]|nr:hypothetical protein SNEBB_004913 [Seison nebaliae]
MKKGRDRLSWEDVSDYENVMSLYRKKKINERNAFSIVFPEIAEKAIIEISKKKLQTDDRPIRKKILEHNEEIVTSLMREKIDYNIARDVMEISYSITELRYVALQKMMEKMKEEFNLHQAENPYLYRNANKEKRKKLYKKKHREFHTCSTKKLTKNWKNEKRSMLSEFGEVNINYEKCHRENTTVLLKKRKDFEKKFSKVDDSEPFSPFHSLPQNIRRQFCDFENRLMIKFQEKFNEENDIEMEGNDSIELEKDLTEIDIVMECSEMVDEFSMNENDNSLNFDELNLRREKLFDDDNLSSISSILEENSIERITTEESPISINPFDDYIPLVVHETMEGIVEKIVKSFHNRKRSHLTEKIEMSSSLIKRRRKSTEEFSHIYLAAVGRRRNISWWLDEIYSDVSEYLVRETFLKKLRIWSKDMKSNCICCCHLNEFMKNIPIGLRREINEHQKPFHLSMKKLDLEKEINLKELELVNKEKKSYFNTYLIKTVTLNEGYFNFEENCCLCHFLDEELVENVDNSEDCILSHPNQICSCHINDNINGLRNDMARNHRLVIGTKPSNRYHIPKFRNPLNLLIPGTRLMDFDFLSQESLKEFIAFLAGSYLAIHNSNNFQSFAFITPDVRKHKSLFCDISIFINKLSCKNDEKRLIHINEFHENLQIFLNDPIYFDDSFIQEEVKYSKKSSISFFNDEMNEDEIDTSYYDNIHESKTNLMDKENISIFNDSITTNNDNEIEKMISNDHFFHGNNFDKENLIEENNLNNNNSNCLENDNGRENAAYDINEHIPSPDDSLTTSNIDNMMSERMTPQFDSFMNSTIDESLIMEKKLEQYAFLEAIDNIPELVKQYREKRKKYPTEIIKDIIWRTVVQKLYKQCCIDKLLFNPKEKSHFFTASKTHVKLKNIDIVFEEKLEFCKKFFKSRNVEKIHIDSKDMRYSLLGFYATLCCEWSDLATLIKDRPTIHLINPILASLASERGLEMDKFDLLSSNFSIRNIYPTLAFRY